MSMEAMYVEQYKQAGLPAGEIVQQEGETFCEYYKRFHELAFAEGAEYDEINMVLLDYENATNPNFAKELVQFKKDIKEQIENDEVTD